MTPEISIIIVSYNSGNSVVECLKSINDQEIHNSEIIIIDNNSRDNTISEIENYIKYKNGYQFLLNKDNLGFAKACNQAANLAKGIYLFFINPDTFFQDNFFNKIVIEFNNNLNMGVAGGTLYYPDGRPQRSGYKFHTLWNRVGVLTRLVDFLPRNTLTEFLFNYYPHDKKPINVDWILGANLVIRKNLFDRIGGFNEDYFMYMEDTELCWEAKKKGYQISVFPFPVFHHFGESSKSNLERTIPEGQRSCNIFFRKNYSFSRYIALKTIQKSSSFIKMVLLILFIPFRNNNKLYISTIKGYFNSLFI